MAIVEINKEVVGSEAERESCSKVIQDVIKVWESGNHDMNSKAYKQLEKGYLSGNCNNLEGFPPFSKIPKA